MTKPLVSIITVVLNNRQGIERTLKSIAAQKYVPIEYIIIDGGSTDGTQEIIGDYAALLHQYISEPDGGIYYAMNKGVALAHGSIVGLLNSGDHYEADAIEAVVNAYLDYPEGDIFHGMLRVFDQSGAFKSVIGNHSSFLSTGMIEHPACFVKRAVYEKHGGFNLNYKSSSDYDFMLRMKRLGVNFVFIEQILTNYYTGGISFQTRALLETLQIRKAFGLISPLKKMLLENIIKLRAFLKK
ncbi:glycosyltransferase family 2 protein [Pedobacter sp.]|uniref:glycosyltransferase family 2 protein n=1 Tax=Pedobacter sp. TaxID=1411316 RepID=UPI003D7FFA86